MSDADRYRKPLTIYPTPALRAAIEQRAKEQRRSLSQVAQFALEEAFAVQPEPMPNEPRSKAAVKLSLRPRA